ncbi:MAG: oligosaccharide flippase family protein [Ardenticatenales bacterium]|nr:oligosaccharide flippase family protein [Ardenticatenales bacterium]
MGLKDSSNYLLQNLLTRCPDWVNASWKRLSQGGFTRNVIVLAGGTTLAQGITVLASLILGRLYLPEDFGILSLYGSIIAMLLVLASWRYEIAIPMPEDEEGAINLVVLSILLAMVMSVVVGIAQVFMGDTLTRWLRAPEMLPYLWLLPLGMLGGGIYQVLNYWAIRQKAFKDIARTRFSQSFGQAAVQIGLGLFHLGPVGLLVGDIVGRTNGAGMLGSMVWQKNKAAFKRVSLASLREIASQYRRFPLISSGSSLLNVAGLQLPVLLLAVLFGPQVVGLFALGQRVIGIPLSLIGQAVAQVYFGEASKVARTAPERLPPLYHKTLVRMLIIGAAPILLLALIGPWLFSVVFGNVWYQAGQYVQLLSLMSLGKFVASPLSQTLNIVDRQDLQLVWDIGKLLALLLCFLLASLLHWSPMLTVGVYGATMFLAYVALILLCSYALRQPIEPRLS